MNVLFPTFEELLHPRTVDASIRERAAKARAGAPLDPVNLFNINWLRPHPTPNPSSPPLRSEDLWPKGEGSSDSPFRGLGGEVNHFIMPHSLTGVDAEIVLLVAKDFPTGSHKVGPAYSVLAEKYVQGEIEPGKHTLVFPSTGNYGIGGSWVGPRAGFKSMVILPAGMSRERFEKIESYGATYTKTYGSESNVKEIYDECNRLQRERGDTMKIMNQFSEMGNYRFHYHVTGNTIVELEQELSATLGTRGVSAFVSAMGSAGTIAAGDRLKQVFPHCKVVGLEPVQCPTLFNNGYGSHEIQGIGDKHVTWIHHVTNMDGLACIDDVECLRILHVFTSPIGSETIMRRYGVDGEAACTIAGIFGISGVCNLLGAIKTARHFGLGKKDVIVTIATDGIDRYRSIMDHWDAEHTLNEAAVEARVGGILRHQKTDWFMDGTPENRRRWHNLKYYTWVEQQGKTVEELDAQLSEEWWLAEQAKVHDVNAKLVALRG
jgi:cysteine synthase